MKQFGKALDISRLDAAYAAYEPQQQIPECCRPSTTSAKADAEIRLGIPG